MTPCGDRQCTATHPRDLYLPILALPGEALAYFISSGAKPGWRRLPKESIYGLE
jgi:hypothetical protein